MFLMDPYIQEATALIIDSNAISRSLMSAQLRDLGVRRISTGSALARAAFTALHHAANDMLNKGSFAYAGVALSGGSDFDAVGGHRSVRISFAAGAAGFDFRAAVPKGETVTIEPNARALIPTGFAVALPIGYEMQIRPRSGLAAKNGVSIVNAPGTVDARYAHKPSVITRDGRLHHFYCAVAPAPERAVGKHKTTETRGIAVAVS